MPNFPLSLDDDASLYLAVNNLRTRLTSSIDASTLTIPVITTSGFPNNGFLTILSDPNDITKAEAIRYEGVTLTTFSGVARGAEGTPALAHNNGDNVDLTVVADHHNELKDAIIAIEEYLGASGSENFVPFAEGGNVILPADLSVQDNLTVSGAGDFGSLNVNGFLTVTNLVTSTGTFDNEISVSGTPVTTGTYAIVNGLTGDVVISGAGNITVTEEGQVVVVSGSGAGGSGGTCYTHEQLTSSTTWNVNHNLGTDEVNYIVLDNSNSQVIPDSFTVVDINSVTITFVSPQDGKATIFPCGTVVTGTTTIPDPLVVATGIITDLYVQDITVSGAGVFLDSLTVSGVPVSTSGTGTGGAGLDPSQNQTITGDWDFQGGLTKNGVVVPDINDIPDLNSVSFVTDSDAIVSGTIGRHTVATSGTIGLWLLDGDLTDATGLQNPVDDSKAYERGSLTDNVGNFYGAFAAGNEGYTSATDADFLITGDITVGGLIRTTDHGAFGRMIVGYGAFGSSVEADNFQWSIATRNGGILRWLQESGAGAAAIYDSTDTLETNTLYHVMAVRESQQITMYVNGEVFAGPSSALTSPTGGSTANLHVNFFSAATGDATMGSIKIIDRALTAEEVWEEYTTVQSLVQLPEILFSDFTAVSGTFDQSLVVSGSSVLTSESVPPNASLFVGALLTTTSGISIPNSTDTPLNWDSVEYDFGGLADLDTYDRGFTIPAEYENSFWVIKSNVRFETIATSVSVYIQPNYLQVSNNYGLHRVSSTNTANNAFSMQVVSHPFHAPAGTQIRIDVRHDRGTAWEVDDFLNNTWFSIERVGVSGTI